MFRRTLFLASALACLAIGVSSQALAGTYITFDIPGNPSILRPTGINNTRVVTGYYYDTQYHGFIRKGDGNLITFDVPGSQGTTPLAINGPGKVVGYYYDSLGRTRGFVRDLAGQYTTLNPPDVNESYPFVFADSINDAGQIAGIYENNSNQTIGFLRDAAGNYTTFAPGDSLRMSNALVNQNGEVAGYYDASAGFFGYTMDPSGSITTFSVTGSYITSVNAINASGQVAGDYVTLIGNICPEYKRDAFGTISIFSPPNCNFSSLRGIKDNGDVIGAYQQYGHPPKGFLRTSAGVISSFRDPGAGAGSNQGTWPSSVSGNGNVAGYYIDSTDVLHGFILTNHN